MKAGGGSGPTAVDAYLAKVPPAMRAALEELRATIREAAPEAEEAISYGIPAFKHHGVLVFYAAFRDHCSFFPGRVAARRTFAKDLAPFRGGKGTVHFTPERPLPASLVKRIVRARVAENEARAKAKRRPKIRPTRRSR